MNNLRFWIFHLQWPMNYLFRFQVKLGCLKRYNRGDEYYPSSDHAGIDIEIFKVRLVTNLYHLKNRKIFEVLKI